jgi:hypothetical protein
MATTRYTRWHTVTLRLALGSEQMLMLLALNFPWWNIVFSGVSNACFWLRRNQPWPEA